MLNDVTNPKSVSLFKIPAKLKNSFANYEACSLLAICCNIKAIKFKPLFSKQQI